MRNLPLFYDGTDERASTFEGEKDKKENNLNVQKREDKYIYQTIIGRGKNV